VSQNSPTDRPLPWSEATIAAIPDRGEGLWWVAHTRPRAEKVLAADLDRLGIFHYLPLCPRVTRSRNTNRISRSMVPVFTGSLFFVATETERYRAMTTDRIVSTLSVPRQEQLVAELRHLHVALGSGTDITRSRQIRTGRWVRIVCGALAGVEGVVVGWRSRVRVALNINILGQSVTVETDADLVELIDPPAYAVAVR